MEKEVMYRAIFKYRNNLQSGYDAGIKSETVDNITGYNRETNSIVLYRKNGNRILSLANIIDCDIYQV